MIFNVQQLGLTIDNHQLLHNVSFSVAKGDWLTIIGPSGSGKSTLLRCLATLMTPTSGSIEYAGKPLTSYEKIAYRREVSYCFQQPSLFGETVYDNLVFPFSIRNVTPNEARMVELLEQVQLPASMLRQPITELSGGEKQRVALIRNVMFEPAVLLLDEVTTGLDADTKQLVLNWLHQLNQAGVTVVAVTHDESEITAATRTLQVVAGAAEELAHA